MPNQPPSSTSTDSAEASAENESSAEDQELKISVDRLRPGIYVELPKGWLNHPFLFNFKSGIYLTSEKQIDQIKKFGFKAITINPEKSSVEPLPSFIAQNQVTIIDGPTEEELDEQNRERRKEIIHDRKITMQRCEKQYQENVACVKKVMSTLMSRPEEAIDEANNLINETVDSLLSDSEIVVNIMSDKALDDNAYFHCMNVSVLSLLLGKAINLSKDDMRILGVGSLFHDIGKNKVPDQILLKKEPLNSPERKALNLHPQYGVEIADKIEAFPREAIIIIQQHHEKLNGKGFPNHLSGNEISILSRISTIANVYDNHCNHKDIKRDFTPYEALSFMYKYQKDELDTELFKVFVHNLGVYPPGSLVQLSNEQYGMVTSVNSEDLLNPQVLLYNESIPREEAIICDLMVDKEIKISKNIRPANLPTEVYKYLNPRKNINYSYDVPGSNKK